jgi:hypothetical protein
MEVRNMIEIKLAEGKTVKFEDGPYPITQADKLKNAPGVYTIWCRSSSRGTLIDVGQCRGTLIDVGQSDNVRDRVMSHDRRECWNKNCKGSLEVAATYIKDEQQRLDLEKKIRQRRKPPCGER